MNTLGIGLLGFGTVGAGVVECLQKNGALLEERIGVRLDVRRIADVDLERDRGVKVDPAILTRDAAAVVTDPAVDIVVELIGGTGIARSLIRKALEIPKPVVTANKALLAEHGDEIFELADRMKTDLGFEASVAGGVPVIRALREGLIANRFSHICGILNGTCNYILTRMDREQMTFDHALKEAQAAGYAEANPGLDIDGIDTAHKAAILASLAYGARVPMSRIHVEGIRGLSKTDIEYARSLGYRVKLLAVIKGDGGLVDIRVHPALVPLDHMLASVMDVFNAVVVDGDMTGQTVYYGRGAGRLPTASAVVSDIADIATKLAAGKSVPRATPPAVSLRYKDIGDTEGRYYIRLALMDKPGTFGQVATTLGQHRISLASVVQKEPHRAGRSVPVVILTHPAVEKDVEAALTALEQSEVIATKAVRLRIEDLGTEKEK